MGRAVDQSPQSLMNTLRQRYGHPPIIGAVFALLLVLSPVVMGGHAYLIFFSLGGLIIVGGGVVTVAFMSFPSLEVGKALSAIKRMFKEPRPPEDTLHQDVTAIIYCARVMVDKKGVRSLEAVVGKMGQLDSFIKYGLNMVLSDYTPDEIRTMMETAADARYERDSVPLDILQAMTSHGPAFGMVGTLIGMIAMLCNLSDNIADIGPNLAVAFLSTLYGVLSARMLYIPAASKMKQDIDRRRFRNYLITEGMVMLVGKKSPMYVQDRLNGFLRPEDQDFFDITRTPTPKVAASVAA